MCTSLVILILGPGPPPPGSIDPGNSAGRDNMCTYLHEAFQHCNLRGILHVLNVLLKLLECVIEITEEV